MWIQEIEQNIEKKALENIVFELLAANPCYYEENACHQQWKF